MTRQLFFQAMGKFFLGLLLVALLLFLPAGSLDYWNAWLLLAILFLPMFAVGILLMFRDPDLLRKRLSARETEPEQKRVIAGSGLLFLGAFLLAGFNHRFGWCPLPAPVVWIATAVFLLAYLFYGEVLRENAYLSRTIEIQAGQKVIDTGLYGVVRHPMYSATLLLFLSMPLVLGSPLSFALLLLYLPLVRRRILNEEAVLEKGLPGYPDYERRVRYRLIPHLW